MTFSFQSNELIDSLFIFFCDGGNIILKLPKKEENCIQGKSQPKLANLPEHIYIKDSEPITTFHNKEKYNLQLLQNTDPDFYFDSINFSSCKFADYDNNNCSPIYPNKSIS